MSKKKISMKIEARLGVIEVVNSLKKLIALLAKILLIIFFLFVVSTQIFPAVLSTFSHGSVTRTVSINIEKDQPRVFLVFLSKLCNASRKNHVVN